MIAMAFITAPGFASGDEVVAEYAPSTNALGILMDASIWLRLFNDGVRVDQTGLNMSIADARVIGAALTQVVLLHDAAVRLAAGMAVA